jgi:hypothetical protein
MQVRDLLRCVRTQSLDHRGLDRETHWVEHCIGTLCLHPNLAYTANRRYRRHSSVPCRVASKPRGRHDARQHALRPTPNIYQATEVEPCVVHHLQCVTRRMDTYCNVFITHAPRHESTYLPHHKVLLFSLAWASTVVLYRCLSRTCVLDRLLDGHH